MVSASLELVGGDEPSGEGLAGELPFRGLEVFCDLEVSAPERVLAMAEGVSRPRSEPLVVFGGCGFCGRGIDGCFDEAVGLETDVRLSLGGGFALLLSEGGLLEVTALLAGSDGPASASSSESLILADDLYFTSCLARCGCCCNGDFLLSFEAAAISFRGSLGAEDLGLGSLVGFVFELESVTFEMGAFPFLLLWSDAMLFPSVLPPSVDLSANFGVKLPVGKGLSKFSLDKKIPLPLSTFANSICHRLSVFSTLSRSYADTARSIAA